MKISWTCLTASIQSLGHTNRLTSMADQSKRVEGGGGVVKMFSWASLVGNHTPLAGTLLSLAHAHTCCIVCFHKYTKSTASPELYPCSSSCSKSMPDSLSSFFSRSLSVCDIGEGGTSWTSESRVSVNLRTMRAKSGLCCGSYLQQPLASATSSTGPV